MKKIISMYLIFAIVSVLSIVAFAGSDCDGNYITEERITQEAVAAVEEEIEWQAEEIKEVLPNSYTRIGDIKIEGLDFETTVKRNSNDREYEIKGTLEEKEGIESKEFNLHGSRKYILEFEVTKKIIVEAVAAVPEETTTFYIGYEYNDCKVMFNKDLNITSLRRLNSKKPFTPLESKIWTWKNKKPVFLYKASDWECLKEEIVEDGTTEGENGATEAGTTETGQVESVVATHPESKIEDMKTIDTVLLADKEGLKEGNLPRTGEQRSTFFLITGIIVLAAGVLLFTQRKKLLKSIK